VRTIDPSQEVVESRLVQMGGKRALDDKVGGRFDDANQIRGNAKVPSGTFACARLMCLL